jgi:hypothetical protein
MGKNLTYLISYSTLERHKKRTEIFSRNT